MCKGNAGASSAMIFQSPTAPRPYTPNRHAKPNLAEMPCVDTCRNQARVMRGLKLGCICFNAAVALAEKVQCTKENCRCQHITVAEMQTMMWDSYSQVIDKAPCPFHKLGKCQFGAACEDAHDAPMGAHGDGAVVRPHMCIARVDHPCQCAKSMQFPQDNISRWQYTELLKMLNDWCPNRSAPMQKKAGRAALRGNEFKKGLMLRDPQPAPNQHHHCAAPVPMAPIILDEQDAKLLLESPPASPWIHNPYGGQWFMDKDAALKELKEQTTTQKNKPAVQ